VHIEKKYQDNGKQTILDTIKIRQERKTRFEGMKAPEAIINIEQAAIDELWQHYAEGKRYLNEIYDLEETIEVPDYEDIYENITDQFTPEEKKLLAISHMGKEYVDKYWEVEGECIHCDGKYILKDSKVVKEIETGDVWIECPHKNCNGSFLDFMPIKK
jgi:hypothetical protein